MWAGYWSHLPGSNQREENFDCGLQQSKDEFLIYDLTTRGMTEPAFTIDLTYFRFHFTFQLPTRQEWSRCVII